LFAATGRIEAAREYLSLTRKLDPSYRGPYNNAGWWYLGERRYDQARSAFARTLSLDPADAYAHLGCGLLAVQEKDWPAAESSLRQALALDDRCVEAYRALGNVLARRLAYPEAVDAYERSLKLALSGHRALTNQMSLSEGADSRTPWDPDHGAVYADLARIHMAAGAWAKAITDYRMAIAAGTIDAAGAWTHLALLYFRTACWRDCVEAIWQASKRMPRLLARSSHGLWVRCRAALRYRREARSRKRPADTALALWI
jgi:tetratricopeptide (TPR) repeat protein